MNGLLKCCFTFTETVGLLGTGAQDGHLDFHTAPELFQRLGERYRFILKGAVVRPGSAACKPNEVS